MLRTATIIVLSLLLVGTASLALTEIAFSKLLYPEAYVGPVMQLEQQVVPQHFPVPLPQSLVRNETSRLLGNALAYIRGDTATANLTIPVRADLTRALDALPPCQGVPQNGTLDCRPPNATIILAQVPQTMNLSTPNLTSYLQRGRQAVQTAEASLQIALILALVCVLLILFLTRKSIRSGAEWIESDMIIVGGSLATTSIAIRPLLARAFPPALSSLQGFVTTVLGTVLAAMLTYGLVAGIGGAALLLFTLLFPKPKKK